MGSSKKHKDKERERRHKHRHRSDRSRSRSTSRDRERSHKRHEKKRRKDVVEEDDDYLYGREELENSYIPPPSSSRTKTEPLPEYGGSIAVGPSKGDGSSLSIEETNKIRAKLGLKPLEVSTPQPGEGGNENKAADEDVHVPAVNLARVRQADKLRERMELQKEKRRIKSKLSRVKTLGDSDSEEDTKAWVKKSRKLSKEKALADKRAKMLEEMDEEFGISGLVEEEFRPKTKGYTSRDLKGLKVQHGLETFKEGQTVILTLQDQGVLEDGEETLYNVNLKDDEFAKKNVENKKKRIDYKPYDEPQYDEYGMIKTENVLSKYDEEIEGKKAESFTLGSGGKYDAQHERAMERIRSQLRQQGQSLQMEAPRLATEFYSHEEMEAKFKKVKKKVRKIRKKDQGVKADDLLSMNNADPNEDFGSRSRGRGMMKEEPVAEVIDGHVVYDHGHGYPSSAPQTFDYNHGLPVKAESMETEEGMDEEADVLGPDEDLTGVAVEEDTAEQELQAALTKARKIKQAKREFTVPHKVAEKVKTELPVAMDTSLFSSMIVLNSTSEFCRSLGDIPTYGLSGNRDEERDEILDHELELERRKRLEEEEEANTGWSAVDVDTRPVNIDEEEKAVLDDEPVVNQGLGGALSLARKKGYLEKEVKKKGTAPKHEHIQAQNYSIEDKRYEDLDEKYRKRDRFSGALVDFKEKATYRPDIKLEYVDDSGRNLTPKEAFRQLSHRFHGKGSGKKKTEKRMKKLEEENLMKQMSSTDTPLGTLNLLQEKQRAEKSAYVLLTGSKGMAANTIVKTS